MSITSSRVALNSRLRRPLLSDNQALLPSGPKIVLTGGLDFNDHRLIRTKLDQIHANHPDMVLLHGASPMVRSSQGAADRLQARLA